jgi:hypothetical protein
MELILVYAALCCMIVVGCSSYWIACQASDFFDWISFKLDRYKMHRTLSKATRDAYSHRRR